MTAPSALASAAALARRLGLRRFWKPAPAPGNFQARDASPEAIARDAQYGFGCGQGFRQHMERFGARIADADILEIGPGTAFGAAAYFAAHGARAAVADRWLAPWQADYHGAYYRAVADLIEAENAGGDASILRRLAAAATYESGPIRLLPMGAEELARSAGATFDAICSNAVLEHLADIRRGSESFARLTRPGGLGVHQVDFRDHRDFSRPLEHLLLSEEAFLKLTKSIHYEYGSQRRQRDYSEAFTAAGFEILEYSTNDRASDAYLADLAPRLAAARASPFRDADPAGLADLGGLFILRRR